MFVNLFQSYRLIVLDFIFYLFIFFFLKVQKEKITGKANMYIYEGVQKIRGILQVHENLLV